MNVEKEKFIMTRNEQMKEIEMKLQAGVEEYFQSDKYATLLKMMSKFHNYSFNNCLLIMLQCPYASYIAGFSTWKNSFHRSVKKGEKAIRIIAPCLHKHVDEDTGEETVYTTYRATSVFDISQTMQIPNTEEIKLGIEELHGDVKDYDCILNAIVETSPVPVSYEQMVGGIKGFYAPVENRIVVGSGMSELQTIKTLLHEISHALLHNPDAIKERKTDRDTKEIEAESTAFIVSSLLGLDTSEYSFEYIANWAGKDSLKVVNDAMINIKDTANQLYDEIQQNLQQNKNKCNLVALGDL